MIAKYYVYILRDPRKNNQPFYIGKGCDKRAWQHLTETKETTDNIRKYYTIQAIKKRNLDIIIEIFQDNMLEENAYDLESELIKKYGRKGIDKNGILTNVVIYRRPPNRTGKPSKLKGLTLEELWGEKKAKKFKKEQASRMKEQRKNGMGPLNPPWNKGKSGEYTQTEETRKSVSEGLVLAWADGRMTGNRGKTMTDESNEKRRKWNIENDWSPSEQIRYKKGHIFSPEMIEKRRQTRLKREAERKEKGIPYYKKDK